MLTAVQGQRWWMGEWAATGPPTLGFNSRTPEQCQEKKHYKKNDKKKKKICDKLIGPAVSGHFFFFNCSLIQSCGESQTERRGASSGRRNYRMQTPSVSQSVTGCRSRLCWRGRHEKKSNTKLCMSIITCLILFAIHILSINSVSSLLIGIKHWFFFSTIKA